MKRVTLFLSSIVVTVVLFGQQTMQKQAVPATGNSSTQKQTNQAEAPKTNNVNTYPSIQKSEPVQRYEPQPVPQQIQQSYPSTYQSRGTKDLGDQKRSASDANNKQKQDLGNNNYNSNDLRSIGKEPVDSRSKNYTAPKPKEVAPMPYPTHLEKPQKDTSGSNNNSNIYPQIGNTIKKLAVCEKSPERVYKLTPTLRLRCIIGSYPGVNGLSGYGVHIASFNNYDYCMAVARWLQKKYKATSYILEDQSGYTHYHLVFGRWLNYKPAEIFKGKIRYEAPNSFVFNWLEDAIQLADNSSIIFIQ